MDNKVSLFIPVYNASGLIKNDLRKCYNALLQLNDDFEIVIVDDNSNDKTYRFSRVINMAKQIMGKDIRYIRYDKGPSRRENLAASFRSAKYGIIGFLDADLSCDVSYFLKAVNLLKEKRADIVIGSRYIKGAKAKRRVVRRVLSFFYNSILKLMFKSKINDHQCGLKVFRRSTVMPIIDKMGYDDKYVRGWFWDAELLIRAQKEKLNIIEMPVEWNYADTSTFDIKRELRCLKAIIKLRRDLKRLRLS